MTYSRYQRMPPGEPQVPAPPGLRHGGRPRSSTGSMGCVWSPSAVRVLTADGPNAVSSGLAYDEAVYWVPAVAPG